MESIVQAKDRQAAEANKNASILLEELDLEKVTFPYDNLYIWKILSTFFLSAFLPPYLWFFALFCFCFKLCTWFSLQVWLNW